MDVNPQELLDQALNLKKSDRAFLAERLIASLEPQTDDDVELAWQKEVQKRAAELDSGKVNTIPWDVVKDQITKEFSVSD